MEVDTDVGYEIRETPGKGEGVFAREAFQPKDTIMVGRILEYLDGNGSHAAQIGERTTSEVLTAGDCTSTTG